MDQTRRRMMAKQLKDNELLTEIFAESERDIIESWRSAQDLAQRESAHAQLKALEGLTENVASRIHDLARDDE
jgi:hypothetical protein